MRIKLLPGCIYTTRGANAFADSRRVPGDKRLTAATLKYDILGAHGRMSKRRVPVAAASRRAPPICTPRRRERRRVAARVDDCGLAAHSARGLHTASRREGQTHFEYYSLDVWVYVCVGVCAACNHTICGHTMCHNRTTRNANRYWVRNYVIKDKGQRKHAESYVYQ